MTEEKSPETICPHCGCDFTKAPKIDRKIIERVFEHWQREWNHPRSKLDQKRRRLIARALGDHSEDELLRAISGYKNSPHHTGENEQGMVYDSIELFLRDGAHIDTGLRLYENPPPRRLSRITQRNINAVADWQPPELRKGGGKCQR